MLQDGSFDMGARIWLEGEGGPACGVGGHWNKKAALKVLSWVEDDEARQVLLCSSGLEDGAWGIALRVRLAEASRLQVRKAEGSPTPAVTNS